MSVLVFVVQKFIFFFLGIIYFIIIYFIYSLYSHYYCIGHYFISYLYFSYTVDIIRLLGELVTSNTELVKAQKSIANSFAKNDRVMKIIAKEVVTQHRLRMDIWSSSKRTKVEQSGFKSKLVSEYQRASSNSEYIKCMILDVDLPKSKVIASHIWKYCTNGEGLEDFNLLQSDVSQFRNGMLLCEDIEKAFDTKRVCFLIDRIRPQNIVLKVLDPSLLDVVVCNESPTNPKETFNSINGRSLQHPPDVFPYRRILDFHAKVSFRSAIGKGWLQHDASFDSFFDMSIDASIPDFNIYQDLSDEEFESSSGGL